MKQLYVAGPLPTPAARNGYAAGPAVRAASAGVRPDEVQAALSSAGYAPPPAAGADGDRPLPVRLALFNTGAGRLLTHVAPNGGTYFAHTLLNIPAAADAQLAIQTWGSPLWQRHEPEAPADLPELPYLPVADRLDDASLRDWLAGPGRRELLEFALAALLGTPPTARVFLAAPADDVAKVVYAVTRALPAGLLDDFTFSTYEPDPLACPARLVGYDSGSPEWDLPAACYGDGNAGFNPATGRRSDLPADVPFAAFAAEALASGDTAALDEVRAAWQRLGLRDARQFDLVFRLTRGRTDLTKEEAADALRHPPLAEFVCSRPGVLSRLLEWALDDRDFATASFPRAVQAVRQRPDAAAKLGQQVRELGLNAVRTGDRSRAANALEVVLPAAAPAKAAAVWGDLLAEFPDAGQLAWELRLYLLPRVIRFKQQQGASGVDPALAKWLDVPAAQLGELLALDLPKAYQIAAARACLHRDAEPPAELVRTLAAHPALALTLLRSEDGAADRPVRLFEALLAEAPAHPWFEDLLARAADYPPVLLNRFFEVLLAAGKVDADRLVRTQGPRLLELFAGQSGLDRVGTQFLANPPADLLRNPAVLDFLARLRDEPQASDELKARIAAVQTVRRHLDRPTFDAESLKPVAEAFAAAPPVLPPGARAELFDAVAVELLRRSADPALQADLEAALVHFGPVLANDPADLFENLLRDLRSRTDLARHPNLVQTFLAVALGAANDPALAGQLDGLDGHAYAIASDAAARGGNRLLRTIDRRAESWPRAARSQWGFLHAAVRPRGLCGLLRDAGLVLAGGTAATAAWWAVKAAGLMP
jgi:hypothetical protein